LKDSNCTEEERGGVSYIAGLSNLTHVRDLIIAGTQIRAVPEEISRFDLVRLAVHGNAILELPEWVIDYVDTNQVVFWISNNLIQEMPDNLLQKHWRIEVEGNQICGLDAADSATIFELSKSGTGGYTLPGEYLSEPALRFHRQKCE
jgi:hypothetical protein